MSSQNPQLLLNSEDWLAFNKPAGWLSIPPTQASRWPILKSWVEQHYGRVWVVHRLDIQTSGVVLFAKNAASHQKANQLFERHQIKKRYEALGLGALKLPVFKVSKPIEGLPSVTQFEVMESFQVDSQSQKKIILFRAYPQSGRRHQIRIHLSKEGCPILGDVRYGGEKEFQLKTGVFTVSRVALHASRLELPGGVVIEAPLPQDFEEWLGLLREAQRHQRS